MKLNNTNLKNELDLLNSIDTKLRFKKMLFKWGTALGLAAIVLLTGWISVRYGIPIVA